MVRGSRIASKARKALDKLPVKRRNYAIARAEGATVAKASDAAGVSHRMGSKYEQNADIQAAYRELVRSALPQSEVVELIKGGCHATVPVYGPDGRKKKDRADWRTRKPYIDMAREDAGYVEKKAETNNAALISVTVQHIGQTPPPTIIEGSVPCLPSK